MNKSRLFRVLSLISLLVACGEKEMSIDVTSITISQPSAEMEVGESLSLKAAVSPSNAVFDGYFWSSTNPKVASVSESGLVTAISEGNTTITVMAGGKTATCSVTVVRGFVAVASVNLSKSTLKLVEGDTETLTATVSPDDATDKTVTWASSNDGIVAVKDGTVIAVMEGEATITAKAGDKTATCTVTVQGVNIELKPSTLDICVGEEADIAACLEPAGARVKVLWESTEPGIVSVDDKGHVTALAPGDATICAATERGKTAFCKVHVRSKMNSVTITAPDGKKDVNIGETLQLTAIINPADLSGMEMEWKTSDTSIATVSADGLVTAKSRGTVTITVTVKNGSETKTASYEIKVLQPVTSISVTPTTLEMFVGDEIEIGQVFAINVQPADADYNGFRYATTTAGIISISQGKISGNKAGTVTLYIIPEKANPKNLKAECKITVKAKVEGITIQGSETKTVQVKKTLQLRATVTPSTANQEVTWGSSDSKIATVEATSGLVTGVKAGTVKITATSKENSSLKATCTVTVENIPVSSIELDKASLTLTEGDTYTLKATVKPDDAHEKTPTWTSSNTSVATVSTKGVVTAIKAGTATITAKCGGKSATCQVTVQAKSIAVTGVSLNMTSMTLSVGDKQTLIVTITPSNATNKSVTWSSSNTTVASVSSSGVVTAKAAGTAKITVKTKDGGKTSTCTVTVQDKQHEHFYTISKWRLNSDYTLGNQDMLNQKDPVDFYNRSASPYNKDQYGWGAVYGRIGNYDQDHPFRSALTEHFQEYMVNFEINEESTYRFEIKNYDVREVDWEMVWGGGYHYGTTWYGDGTGHAYVEFTGEELKTVIANPALVPYIYLVTDETLIAKGYDVLVEVQETCAELGYAEHGYYFVVFKGLNAMLKLYNVKLGTFRQNCDFVLAPEVVEGIYDAYYNKLFEWDRDAWKATEAAKALGIFSADKLSVEFSTRLMYYYDSEESFGGCLYTFTEWQEFEYSSSTNLSVASSGINWWNYGRNLQVDKKAMFTVQVLWGEKPDEYEEDNRIILCEGTGTILVLATANSIHPLHNANGSMLGPIGYKDGWLYAIAG